MSDQDDSEDVTCELCVSKTHWTDTDCCEDCGVCFCEDCQTQEGWLGGLCEGCQETKQ